MVLLDLHPLHPSHLNGNTYGVSVRRRVKGNTQGVEDEVFWKLSSFLKLFKIRKLQCLKQCMQGSGFFLECHRCLFRLNL